ncbi:Na+/H+ antiporter NhaA [Streptomyces sp. WMMB303]|uniref:Na+/H+ antiporter NhaA n=1 Tax=Streptomyces sp. WMMB303 TaxID=3034154 RepID=UPI0023ECAB3D|nr:Na+/H+ antiporter NhaA [Streptomyces sp. WMMB303]MDF4254287.1 Na+/H+ antiporter NhaA [Streptomyces sp. WMMB303]
MTPPHRPDQDTDPEQPRPSPRQDAQVTARSERSAGQPAPPSGPAGQPAADHDGQQSANPAETSAGRNGGHRSVFLGRLPLRERTFLADALRTETVGGTLLLAAAVVALLLANTGAVGFYQDVKDFHFGPEALHLNLSVADWAKDGLLTLFFFVAGIELKRELVAGELRDPRAAALPIVSAVCGMAVPALVYLAFAAGGGDLRGWAIPMATDIAFALGVLAVLGTGLPSALRAFLLTLAVVDDLGAIVIIAIFYSAGISFGALAGAVTGLAVFWFLHHRGVRGWYVYVPLALVVWGLMHASGVHATVAGVAMGLMLRCSLRPGEETSPAAHIEHRIRPLSSGLAVPVFALFAAGVTVSGGALGDVFSKPETLGVVFGLLAGKTLGVFGGAWAAVRFTKAELNRELGWADVLAIAALSGIGFTVSLLISELAFTDDPVLADEAKAAVLIGSLLAAVFAGIMLKIRARRHRSLVDAENRDEDGDGVPDVYEEHNPAFHLRMAALYEAKAAEHRRLAEVATRHDVTDDGPA